MDGRIYWSVYRWSRSSIPSLFAKKCSQDCQSVNEMDDINYGIQLLAPHHHLVWQQRSIRWAVWSTGWAIQLSTYQHFASWYLFSSDMRLFALFSSLFDRPRSLDRWTLRFTRKILNHWQPTAFAPNYLSDWVIASMIHRTGQHHSCMYWYIFE